MSIVNSLERMGDWLAAEVCRGVELKPMDADVRQQAEGFDYQLVEPSVHVLYVPTHNQKPPDMVATIPSIVIQVQESKDDLIGGVREYTLRLSFTTWDPGVHGPDVLAPTGEVGLDSDYARGAKGELATNADGWRDAFSFMDRALRVIEEAGEVGGLALKRSAGVAWGNYEPIEAPDELWPFWLCWARFVMVEPLFRPSAALDALL